MAGILTEQQLNNIINDYITKLKQRINLEQIILYGSYAKGNANEWSDIDLYIVSKELPENELKGTNGFNLDCLVGKFDPRLEVIGINPNQLKDPIEKSFFEEVRTKGKLITF